MGEAHLSKIVKVDLAGKLFSYDFDATAHTLAEMMDGKLLLVTNASGLTLEGLLDASPGTAAAVRLGLRLVKGFSREAAMRIVAARTERPFPDVDELALRARLDAAALKRLAEAGALERLAGHRRQALWQAAAGHAPEGVLRGARIEEPRAELAAPSEAQALTPIMRGSVSRSVAIRWPCCAQRSRTCGS